MERVSWPLRLLRRLCGSDSSPGLGAIKEIRPRTESGIHTITEHIKHVSDASFEQDVVKSDKPVLLEFWAEWCRPCKTLAPVLDEVAKDYADRLQIARINTDKHPSLRNKFDVLGVPTLILFKNGAVAAQTYGPLSKAELTAFLDGNL